MQGKSIRCTIGRSGHFTPEQARKIAKEKLYFLSISVDPNKQEKEAQAKTVTLADALEDYRVSTNCMALSVMVHLLFC